MKKALAALAAMFMAALAAPVAAHADNNSFRQYLIDHGYQGLTGPQTYGANPYTMFMVPDATTIKGHAVCDNLRSGMTPDQIHQQYSRLVDYQTLVDAAQHELCPDTLR
jgi:hypothetical protein